METTRTAIITGASKGIGAAIARRLAADGLQVVVNYSTSADVARDVVTSIEAAGGRAEAVQADVGVASEVAKLFDAAESRFGPIDVLVNNAGVSRMSPLAEVSDRDYHLQVGVNMDGVFHGLREGARRLRDGGRIVSLSTSIVGTYMPGAAIYAATKAAVETMTRVLAKELGPRGVTVNAVAPGPVATELLLADRPAEVIQRLIADIPLGRLGDPEDVASVVAFLVGPDGGWVSGQVLRANGGRN